MRRLAGRRPFRPSPSRPCPFRLCLPPLSPPGGVRGPTLPRASGGYDPRDGLEHAPRGLLEIVRDHVALAELPASTSTTVQHEPRGDSARCKPECCMQGHTQVCTQNGTTPFP